MRLWRAKSLTCLLAGLLAMIQSGCTRVITTGIPQSARQAAPITVDQIGDLHSNRVKDRDGNQFITALPEACAGVARELNPPFIVDHHPLATDDGHWTVRFPEESVEELTAVYPSDFDAQRAVAGARKVIAGCQDTVLTITTDRKELLHFRMGPSVPSGSPSILLWSFSAPDWACNDAYVAAYNAAIEITACGPAGSANTSTLAHDALKRIEALAKNVS